MKRLVELGMLGICIIFASVYIYPIFSGLILLPLDLLVSNFAPWLYANTILLKNPYMLDSIIQMFPWKHLTFISLTTGSIPFWNPYQFTGMPFMAAMKPLVFYPGNLLFFFGEITAWNALLWLQLFISCWGTYRFVRSMNLSPLAAIISGIAFAFSSLMMGVLQFGSEGQVLMFLPWLLYFVRSYIKKENIWYLVGFTISVVCSLLAGHLQYFSYMLLLTSIYTVYIAVEEKKYASLWHIGICIFLGVGMGSIQLFPGIQMFLASYRGVTNDISVFADGLLEPQHLLKFFSPDWFGNPVTHDLRWGYIEASGYFGIIPLLLSLYAMIHVRSDRYVKFFTWVFIISTILSMKYIGNILWYLHIPVITSGWGGRIIILTIFSGAILSGFGLNAFLSGSKERSWNMFFYSFVIIVLCVLGVGIVSSKFALPFWVAFSNVKLQVGILLGTAIVWTGCKFLKKKIVHPEILFALLLLCLSYLDLFRMGYRFLTFSNPKYLYPDIPVISFLRDESRKTFGRVYGLTDDEIYSYFQIPTIETYNPLFSLRTGIFLQALEGTQGKHVGNTYHLTKNERMKYVLDFLGVKYIATGKDQNPALEFWNSLRFENEFTRIYKDQRNEVFENITAYPRFSLYYDVIGNASDEEVLRHVRTADIDFRTTLFIAEAILPITQKGIGKVDLTRWDADTVILRTTSSSSAYLYLSDAYDSDWKVTVNGKEEKVLRANYNFRAVYVPSGTAEVVFTYKPKSFVYGLIASGVSFIVWLGCLMFLGIKRKKQKNKDKSKRHF